MKKFDYALSFAGEQRDIAQEIHSKLSNLGFTGFYDFDYSSNLVGEDLVPKLRKIYKEESLYVIALISSDYKIKMWPKHEFRSAMENVLVQDNAYLIPIKIDDTQLESLSSTMGYLNFNIGIDLCIEVITKKIIQLKYIDCKNLGEIFTGEWKLNYHRKIDNLKGEEVLKIDTSNNYSIINNKNLGTYGIPVFQKYLFLNNFSISENKLKFDKNRTGNIRHSTETLEIVNPKKIKGTDHLGFDLIYEKISD